MTSVSTLRSQMVIGQLEQLVTQLIKVGQLAVESDTEPFPFATVMAFKRLSEGTVVAAAGGVANVTDGCPALEFTHDRFVLGPVVEAERLDDAADLPVGVEDFIALEIVGREPGRQLTTVL